MTRGENIALKIADKYKGHLTDQDRVKHLAGEVTELARAIESENIDDILDEIGDCAFLLSHILSRYDKKYGIIRRITEASEKMEKRHKNND